MHSSCTFLRKTQSSLYPSLFTPRRLNFRPIFTQSNNTPSSSFIRSNEGSSSNESEKRSGSILRSISSGAVIVGSSLGFWYWSSLSDSNSFLCYADSPSETFESEKKPVFLVGGTTIFSHYNVHVWPFGDDSEGWILNSECLMLDTTFKKVSHFYFEYWILNSKCWIEPLKNRVFVYVNQTLSLYIYEIWWIYPLLLWYR